MTLRECYEALGGDYDAVLGRLRTERLIQKFVLKFLDDGSFALLCRSMEEGNAEEAFRASHTIKGMCQNLSFTALERVSSELTEALRGGSITADKTGELFARVQAEYQRTSGAIRAFAAEL